MKPNSERKAGASMRKAVEFIQRSTQSELPANVFVVLDTHSDVKSGGLQWGGGATRPKFSPASELVARFCGQEFLGAMKAGADRARSMKPPSGGEWYDDSAFSRGGWRALLLSTCSPAMRVEGSFADIRGLVEE